MALRRLGFEVTTAHDAGRTSLNEALRVFTRDARLERDTDVRFETVALGRRAGGDSGGVVADGDPRRVPESASFRADVLRCPLILQPPGILLLVLTAAAGAVLEPRLHPLPGLNVPVPRHPRL